MKILKYLLIGLFSLIVLVLIAGLFVKKEYAVERQITINKPKLEVFEYVKLLKNQDNFSVWANRDPKMKKEFRGEDGKVGCVSAWDSDVKDVGKGEQEIKRITEGKRIDFELRFMKPFEATDNACFSFATLDSTQTNIKWGFNGKMKYPMNIMLLFMNMDEMLGKDLETGLVNLKAVMEKK
jgi:hypothetical protein